ncbi:hypothetical protein XH88_33330 [Bradyrhizobium sp. CCBAU 51627]|nr:hypothetical protein [Bradyrhizobium sp. CCBAU 51627]
MHSWPLVEVIVSGDNETAISLLDASPHLATECAARGAVRQAAKENFFESIRHYIYEGDTALHMERPRSGRASWRS